MGLMGSPFPQMTPQYSHYQFHGGNGTVFMMPQGGASPHAQVLHGVGTAHGEAGPSNATHTQSTPFMQAHATYISPQGQHMATAVHTEGGYMTQGGMTYQRPYTTVQAAPPHAAQGHGVFKVPHTPGSRSVQRKQVEEVVDLEVSRKTNHKARRAHNRNLHKEFEAQVISIQESGSAPVIRLRTNSDGVVCELKSKWHAAIKSLCHRYLRYSIREFDKQDKKLVRCIINTITNKMFRYEPYPLAQDAVKDFLQSHLNVSRSRFRKYWLNNGCDDFIPHPSMCPDDWRECARFWKSEEGNALSERMIHVRACVGNRKISDNGEPYPLLADASPVCVCF